MQGKTREDLIFNLHYSYNLENLYYHFNHRLNNLLITTQLLLSSAIIGNVSQYVPHLNAVIGVILAMISVLVLVYRFSEKSGSSRISANHYSSLVHRYSQMSDDELAEALLNNSEADERITGAVVPIAFKRSAIQLGLNDDTKLSYYQSFIAKFCGESFR